MRIDRNVTRIIRNSADNDDSQPAKMTPEEALSFVWELTKEVYSLSKEYDVESRLQRNVVTITRKQR